MRIDLGHRIARAVGVYCIAFSMISITMADEQDADPKYWIDRLESAKFADRSEAMQKLLRLGRSAIHSLEATTRHDDADKSQRAFDLLRSHFAGEDPTLQEDASSALQRIANDPTHRKWMAAKETLTPQPKADLNPFGAPMWMPALNQGMRIQLNAGIQIKGGGGRKELSISENGETFRFVEDKDGIKVERPDGNGGTKKSSYKDAQELKAKDPESHGKYEKFFGGKNGIRIEIGGMQKPGNPN